MFFLFHFLVVLTNAAQEGCGRCNYPYINTTSFQQINSSRTEIVNMPPVEGKLLTIVGDVWEECASRWNQLLFMKKDNKPLFEIEYYQYKYDTESDFHFYDLGQNYYYYFASIPHNKHKVTSFKVQFGLGQAETSVYVDQNKILNSDTSSGKSGSNENTIGNSIRQLEQIYLYNGGCITFRYISVCPLPTSSFCGTDSTSETIKIGSPTKFNCSTRIVIIKDTAIGIEDNIKWSFQHINGSKINNKLLRSQNMISTIEKENLLTSTLSLSNFTSQNIGTYSCILSNAQSDESRAFQVTDEPEIHSFISNQSLGWYADDLPQPISFILTGNTTLNWMVTRLSDMQDLTLDLHLTFGVLTPKVIMRLVKQQNVSSRHGSRRNYTLSLAQHHNISSITAVFKLSNRTFKQLTYVPKQIEQAVEQRLVPCIEQEVVEAIINTRNSDVHTLRTEYSMIIGLVTISLFLLIAIILNHTCHWVSRRIKGFEWDETLANIEEKDRKREEIAFEDMLEDASVIEDSYHVYVLYEALDKINKAVDDLTTLYDEKVADREDDRLSLLYATVDKSVDEAVANAYSNVNPADIVDGKPNMYEKCIEDCDDYATFEDVVMHIDDEDAYSTLHRD